MTKINFEIVVWNDDDLVILNCVYRALLVQQLCVLDKYVSFSSNKIIKTFITSIQC